MKRLLLIAMLAFASVTLNAQCVVVDSCSNCTTPFGITVTSRGSELWVNWNHNWQWGYGCSQGLVIFVNGTEYRNSGETYHPAMDGGKVEGFTYTQGTQVCVVLRNYCYKTNPMDCNLTYYSDSPAWCGIPVDTNPTPAPAVNDCFGNCAGGKYKITKAGYNPRCVTKSKCQAALLTGWNSTCNCN
jgi:hypothetical protein